MSRASQKRRERRWTARRVAAARARGKTPILNRAAEAAEQIAQQDAEKARDSAPMQTRYAADGHPDDSDRSDAGTPDTPQPEPSERTPEEIAANVLPDDASPRDLSLLQTAIPWPRELNVNEALYRRNAAMGLGLLGPGQTYNQQMEAYRQGQGPLPDGRLALAAGQLTVQAIRNAVLMESQNQKHVAQQYQVHKHQHVHLHQGPQAPVGQPDESQRPMSPEHAQQALLALLRAEQGKRHRAVERGEVTPPRVDPQEAAQVDQQHDITAERLDAIPPAPTLNPAAMPQPPAQYPGEAAWTGIHPTDPGDPDSVMQDAIDDLIDDLKDENEM